MSVSVRREGSESDGLLLPSDEAPVDPPIASPVASSADVAVSERRFRALFDQFPYSIQIFSPDGATVATNRAWEELFGLTLEAVASFNPLEDPQLAPIIELVRRGFDGEAIVLPATLFDPSPYQIDPDRPANEPFWVEAAVCPVRNEDGSVEEVFIVHRNVSEERIAKEHLRVSEASYRAIFELAGDAIYVHDLETGEILDANRRALDLHGLETLEQLKELGIEGIRGAEIPAGGAGPREAPRPGETHVFESMGRHGDGREFWVEVSLNRAVILGQERVVAVVRNVEDRKRAELALQEAYRDLEARVEARTAELAEINKALEQEVAERRRAESAMREAIREAEEAREAAEEANRAKSDFLSRMSHELRTPLNGILGFGQLLARKELPGIDKRSVDQILRAGNHLLHLINEVLDIARIEAKRESLSLEPVMVDQAMTEAIELVRPLAVQMKCTLEYTPPEEPGFVRADRRRLVQILLNLLSNGIKYNRPGGHVRIRVGAPTDDPAAPGSRVHIEIEDDGPGVDVGQKDRLFAPFDRMGAEQSGVEGTGLGLALSRGLARAMDGELDVRLAPAGGSIFWIDLPAAAPHSASTPTAAGAERAGDGAEALHGSVLYVEDNLANVNLVESILDCRPGVKLMVAQQGRTALDLALQHQPDVILLDLHLPDMDGYAVLRELRRDVGTRSIPVVVISADALPQTARRVREADADGYLTKPIDVDEFLRVLDGFLERRGQGRKSAEQAQGA